MCDALFPRAVEHCLSELTDCFSKLPNSDDAMHEVAALRRQLKGADFEALMQSGLHDYIDTVQSEIGEIHQAIATTWFLPQVQVSA